jgi:hypothetical protein
MKKYSTLLRNLLITFLVVPSVCYSTGYETSIGARSAGMGRCSVAINDLWSVQNNQAGIALLDQFYAGIAYENRFLLNELSTKSLGIIAPTKYGVLGLSYRHEGFDLYNEQKVGLAYAKSFGQYLRIGLQLDYLQTSLGDGYGKKSSVTFELGLQSDITENVTIGIWTFNPVRVKLADYDNEKIQAIYKFGLGWQLSDQFIASVELEKNTSIRPVIVRLGMEYNMANQFFIRTGTSTKEELFTIGFGFKYKHIHFDIGATMHETLGFSPQASLQIGF